MSAPCPNRWTGKIALVRGVISLFYEVRVKVEGVWVYVHKDRRSPHVANCLGSSEEGEWCSNHFVAGTYAKSVQADKQSICAAVYADGVLCVQISGNLLLEGPDLGAHNELAGLQNTVDGILNAGFQSCVLRLRV